MIITAKQTYVRGGQQKLTDVTRVVKKMSLANMRVQLARMNKDAARRILETLNQAVFNAQNNHGISADKLVVKEMLVLRGPHYKRMRAVSRGMGHAILKRTSHIVIRLESKEDGKVEKKEVAPEVKSEESVKVAPKTEAKKPVMKKPTVKKVVKKKTE